MASGFVHVGLPFLPQSVADVGKPIGDDANKLEESRDLEHELDVVGIGYPSENGRTYAAKSERKSEESTRNHPDIARQKFSGVDQYGRHGRRVWTWRG